MFGWRCWKIERERERKAGLRSLFIYLLAPDTFGSGKGLGNPTLPCLLSIAESIFSSLYPRNIS